MNKFEILIIPFELFAKLVSYIYTPSFHGRINKVFDLMYSAWIKRKFLKFEGYAYRSISFWNAKCISVGKNTYICKGVILDPIKQFQNQIFNPEIVIGNNCRIMHDVQITSSNSIKIGNEVGISAYTLIIDTVHGDFTPDSITYEIDGTIPDVFHKTVFTRDLYSAGPVVIEDAVHIGHNCVIMPGVTIGHHSVINSHTVVTKSIPPYSIVSGNPGKIIVSFGK